MSVPSNVISILSGAEAPNKEAVLQAMMDLIFSAKQAQQNLAAREKALAERINVTERFLNGQVTQLQSVVEHFQTILAETGTNDWLVAMNDINKESKEQTKSLHEIANDVKKFTKETSVAIDKASTQMVKNLNKTLTNLHPAELERLAEETSEEIKTFSSVAMRQMTQVLRWFNWKNLLAVAVISFVVTIFTGLYIDDEWPWEAHKDAVNQRLAGKAVIHAWAQLNQTDQRRIMADMG